MLKIIQGSFSSVTHLRLKEEIRELVNQRRKVFLIVPEQQTVISEKEMADFLPPFAPLVFEATNFTRLANTVFRSIGGIAGEYVDKAASALIMWRTLDELSAVLSMTEKHREINTGMVEAVIAAVKEMNSLSIDADLLDRASKSDALKENLRLKAKLSDLSQIMTLYKSLLSEKFLDSDDDLVFLTRAIKENRDLFADTTFFIEGFSSFTAPQRMLISELCATSGVVVYLPMSKLEENSFEYTELSLTKERLISGARASGSEIKIIFENEQSNDRLPIISRIASLLWKNDEKIDTDADADAIRIFALEDPYEECDFLFSDIKSRVMKGDKYSDFAVIFRNAESYAKITESAASKVNVPIFISKRRDLSAFEPVKLIYTALAIIGSDFSREDVITYAKCALSGVDREACDDFELYTNCWKINGKRFYDGIAWNMNPDGYTERLTEAHTEKLLRINEARDKIVTPILKLNDNLKESHTVREFCESLMNFIIDIELEKGIRRRTDELLALGEEDSADECSKIFAVICSALDKLVRVLGDSKTDRRAFESQLKTVISNADIGKIPAYTDSVAIGSADTVRLYAKKHVYLVGVNLGEFPQISRERSYFSDRDRLLLGSLGIPVNDERNDTRCARELYIFTRSFCLAQKSVTLMYSKRGADLAPTHPSEVIARIREITDDRIRPIEIEDVPASDKIYTFDTAVENLDALSKKDKASVLETLTALGYSEILALSEREISNDSLSLSDASLSLAYDKENISLTQSIIDRYVSCPFSHFLRYTLNLSESSEASFDSRNIGNFIHAVLERFFKELAEKEGKVTELSDSEKKDLVRSVARGYVESVCADSSARTGRMEMLVLRLCHATMPIIEDMCDEMRDCKFTPKFFELPIKKFKEGYPAPCEFVDDGHRIFVYGNIDRVDTYKSGNDVYVRVIDYKTGSKIFTRDDISEGKNLQMFLYLKSIVETDDSAFLKSIGVEEGGSLIPAGVIYVKSDLSSLILDNESEDTVLDTAKKNQLRRGMILDDTKNIEATSKAHSPVKFKKDGTPDARTAQYLYSEEEWDDMCDVMGDVVKSIGKRMTSGIIAASPDKESNPCSYCRYKVICRKNSLK